MKGNCDKKDGFLNWARPFPRAWEYKRGNDTKGNGAEGKVYGGQDGKTIKKKKMPCVGILQSPSYLYEGLRLPMKLNVWRTPPTKKCSHVGL
jgi:hypothetical protein